MAKPSRATQAKRQRELAKLEKQEDKRVQRAERRQGKEDRTVSRTSPDWEDPDLAGIVAGPQPPSNLDG